MIPDGLFEFLLGDKGFASVLVEKSFFSGVNEGKYDTR